MPSMTPTLRSTITMDHPHHVTVRQLSPVHLDFALRRYLLADLGDEAVARLRGLLEAKLGGAADFSDVGTVGELLIFLAAADYDHPAFPEVAEAGR